MVLAPPRFAILSITYYRTNTGYYLQIVTDVLCHLYMRYTIIPPKRHLGPVIMRGTAFRTEPRFCFDVYEDNEQMEAGDTFLHSFFKENWNICVTRWFYFWGTVLGASSPSESAIFEKHAGDIFYDLLIEEKWEYTVVTPTASFITIENWES